MRDKIKTLIIMLMLVLTSIVLIPEEIKSISDPPGGDNEIGLDTSYVYNITYDLSDIINDPAIYPNGTLAKGRFFATPGEHHAANLIADWMNEIGLWDPTDGSEDPYFERIDNGYSDLYHIRFKHDFDDDVVFKFFMKICLIIPTSIYTKLGIYL